MSYDASEQGLVLDVFRALLGAATKDGGAKRARGEKPPWWRDPDHEKAIYSHLNKWKHGEARDADSGAHPLVHLAWRALAIAYQETYGKIDPAPAWVRRYVGVVVPADEGGAPAVDHFEGSPYLDVGEGPRAMLVDRTVEVTPCIEIGDVVIGTRTGSDGTGR